VEQLKRRQPVLWENDLLLPFAGACQDISLTEKQVYDAKDRLTRFAPFFASAFPETTLDKGIIESDLKDISGFVDVYNLLGKRRPEVKRLLIKKDSHLPISGSVKARGGIYEVLCLAERIALQEGM
jgi:D-serine dehydratase